MPPEGDADATGSAGTTGGDNSGATQSNETNSSATGDNANNGANENNTDSTNQEEDFDKDRALGTIRALRETEKQLKKRATDAERRAQTLEDAQKSQAEKDAEELEALRSFKEEATQRERERVTRDAFTIAATKVGALKPDALFKLADGLEVGDDGRPTNTNAVMKELQAQYPELFGPGGSADGGSGRGQQPASTDMSTLLRNARSARAAR